MGGGIRSNHGQPPFVSITGGGTAMDEFTELIDTPNSYATFGLDLVRVNAGETALEFVDPSAIIPDEFTDLTDTPANYVGDSLKAVRVNVGETALEFYTPATGIDEFTDLIDTPASYVGEGGQFVCVNFAETALEFIAPFSSFTSLSDTPGSYNTHAGKIVTVNGAENALEFTDVPAKGIGSDFDYGSIWIPADRWSDNDFNDSSAALSEFLFPNTDTRRPGWKFPDQVQLEFFWAEAKQEIDWAGGPEFMLRPLFTFLAPSSDQIVVQVASRNLFVSDDESDDTTFPWSSYTKYAVSERSDYDLSVATDANGLEGFAVPTPPQAYDVAKLNAPSFRMYRDSGDVGDTSSATCIFWGAALQYKHKWPSSTKWTAATAL